MFYAINYSHTIITRTDRHPVGENIVTIIFLLISFLGFIKTKHFFTLKPILNKLSISRKIEVLNLVRQKMNGGEMTERGVNDFRFLVSGPWYTNFTLMIVIFIDEDGFYLNVRDFTDFPYFFFYSNLIEKKIITQINVALS